MSRYGLSIAAITGAAFLWAFEGIVLMPSIFNLNTAFIVLMIHLIGFAALNIFFFRRIKKLKDFTKVDYAFFSLIGLFGGAIGTLAIVKALMLVQFQALSVVLLLQKLQPVFAIILAMLLLKEKPGKNFALWAAIAMLASYPLTFGFHLPNLQSGANTVYAALLALVAAFSFGSATVFGRKMAAKFDFVTVTYFRYGFTALIMLFYIFLFSQVPSLGIVTAKNWAILLVIPLTTGLGAMLLYYFGLKNVSATIATICELFFPVSAIFLDYIVNGTFLSPVQLISAVILIFSITMLTLQRSKDDGDKKRKR
jgi:drug/metabolite transporter (DMT)-like permease